MKKNIAIVWGGYSSEIIVSEKSMKGIYSFLDHDRYNVYTVRIDKESWTADVNGEIAVVDKNDFSIKLGSESIIIDFAYITIHGTPGEDGRLQGYFDMIKMPYSSCDMMASALTFNKFICNRFLKNFGVIIANSIHLRPDIQYQETKIVEELGLPVFVKPNVGGSSFATTKVKSVEELKSAIELAFKEANEVIIESFIAGREVTCGCYKTEKETLLPITEVVTKNEFFDYNAKYEGAVEEITPADLSAEMTKRIQEETSRIYDLVGAKGIVRADYIISDGIPYFLEINTTPGMTATSFLPQQIAAAGLDIKEVFTEIIEHEFKKH